MGLWKENESIEDAGSSGPVQAIGESWKDHVEFKPSAFRGKNALARSKGRFARSAFTEETARQCLVDFDKGGHVFVMTKGQASFIDFIIATLEKTGPANVCLWTWVIADYETQTIRALLAHQHLTGFRMVIDAAGARMEKPIMIQLQNEFGVDCLRVTKTHAKMASIYNDDWSVLLRGSCNLNHNPRLENIDISEGDPPAAAVREAEEQIWRDHDPLPMKQFKNSDAIAMFRQAGNYRSRFAWLEGMKTFEHQNKV